MSELGYESLELLRKMSPAWRLLTAAQAPFVASFLHRAFIEPNAREVSEQELLVRLESYRAALNAGRTEELLPRSARDYLNEWADDEHRWLRKFYPADKDEPSFDITPQTQAALEWLASLMPQSYLGFIGTESRLITVFELLQQIIEGTEQDPEARIANLEQQKQRIEAQIEAVRSGHIEVYNPTQVRERFVQAITLAREILGDFRAVEQNFRDLDRRMRERISVWEKGKGELLEHIFEDRDSITGSEQGASFSAFWRFLMSQSSQERFQDNLERVLELEPVREMVLPGNIRSIHGDWVNAGAYVQDTVARLNGQLRRYVDENYLQQERRILDLARSIESHALAVREAPPVRWHIEIDGDAPEFTLPLDRPLWTPSHAPALREVVLELDEADVPLDALYEQVYVDKPRLLAGIEQMLELRDAVALSQVIAKHPLQQGLSEVLAYLSIWAEREVNLGTTSLACDNDNVIAIDWQDASGRQRRVQLIDVVYCTTSAKPIEGKSQ